MAVCWLHISDFHFRAGDPYDRNVVLRALVEAVKRYRANGRSPDLIFATGDIANSGQVAEYELASAFFDKLLAAADLDKRRLFVVPGNHDVDRARGEALVRTLDTREKADRYFSPATPMPHIRDKQGAFMSWHNRYFDGIRAMPDNSTCGLGEVVDVRGQRIGILPINGAIFCQDDDDHGKLFIGRRSLEAAAEQLGALGAELNVALVHHPLDWLSPVEGANIRSRIQCSIDVLLRGHLHETDVESVYGVNGGYLQLAAGAAYQTRQYPNRALYASFDGSRVVVFPIRYEDTPTEVWTTDSSLFPHDTGHEKAFEISRLAGGDAVRVARKEAEPSKIARFRSNIPSRLNLPFEGRDVLLHEISSLFAKQQDKEAVVVLHGAPGVGKSELAREFARQSRERYPGGCFFVDAGMDGAPVDLARIGGAILDIELPSDLRISDQCLKVLTRLGASPTLLIYDNAISPDAIRPWLPPAGMPCHVIITSNLDNWGTDWPMLDVQPLTADASFDVVVKIGGDAVAAQYGKELSRIAAGLPAQLVPSTKAVVYEVRRGRTVAVPTAPLREAHASFSLVYGRLETPVKLLLHAAAQFNPQRVLRDELFAQMQEALGWPPSESERRLDACRDLHLLEGSSEMRMHQLFATFLRQAGTASDLSDLQLVRSVQVRRFVAKAREVAARPNQAELALVLMAFDLAPEAWD